MNHVTIMCLKLTLRCTFQRLKSCITFWSIHKHYSVIHKVLIVFTYLFLIIYFIRGINNNQNCLLFYLKFCEPKYFSHLLYFLNTQEQKMDTSPLQVKDRERWSSCVLLLRPSLNSMHSSPGERHQGVTFLVRDLNL
jgi:hypothetical protein